MKVMKGILTDFLNMFFDPEELDKEEPSELSRGKMIWGISMLLIILIVLSLLHTSGVSMM